MLLRFSVRNFLSFNDEETLDLLPSSRGTECDELIHSDTGKQTHVLPLALLYGANASGKSNLFKAMAFSRSLIIEGTQSDRLIMTKPFALNKDNLTNPSVFRFVFKNNGVLYDYGFAVDKYYVHEEWLFANYKRKYIPLFTRAFSDGRSKYSFGAHLRGRSKQKKEFLNYVSTGTRINQLFLYEANDKNVSELKDVMDWFKKKMVFINPNERYKHLTSKYLTDINFRDSLSHILRLADIDIDEVIADKQILNLSEQFPGIDDDDLEKLENDIASLNTNAALSISYRGKRYAVIIDKETLQPALYQLKTVRNTKTLGPVLLDPADESDGTQRIMDFAPFLEDLNRADRTYIIDEIDRSLHPCLCLAIIEGFLRRAKRGIIKGQIVTSTHCSGLLNSKHIRHDEIYFLEKDPSGASHIDSLSNYHVRGDLRLEKGYLRGRFGAIPILGDFSKI